MEPQVLIRCREADLHLVESILPEAIAKYSEAMKKPCTVTIAKENCLPANTYSKHNFLWSTILINFGVFSVLPDAVEWS